MSTAIVGRDAELASIRDFVASVSDGAAALVLQGEAGVGKTTLWAAAAAAGEAEERGTPVLRARPAESETALSFSGLGTSSTRFSRRCSRRFPSYSDARCPVLSPSVRTKSSRPIDMR